MTEAFPFLAAIDAIPGVRAGWVERVAGLRITGDRDEAMRQLRPFHEQALEEFAGSAAEIWRAEQVHGSSVAVVPGSLRNPESEGNPMNHAEERRQARRLRHSGPGVSPGAKADSLNSRISPNTRLRSGCPSPQIEAADGLPVVAGVDGLITAEPGVVLVVYVADCGAIWLADRKSGAIGLLHSGKKGTEADIFQNALARMAADFGTRAADVTAVLGPCIRPPDYEIDFAAEIGRQADRAGVGNFIDCGLNTASDLARFYSYRKELGKTGRMMAMIVREYPP